MFKSTTLEELEKLELRYKELEELLASYETIHDKQLYNKYARELASLKEPVALLREYKKICKEADDIKAVLEHEEDKQMLELAGKEARELEEKKKALLEKLENLSKGEDDDAGRDCILEVRPGTGGLEAGLFAAALYRMYTKYAARKGWSVETMSSNSTELGGIKEVVFSVKGQGAYKRLKFESGVHRVQRVPTTEAQGRIHTSTATVAVLAEPEEVELVIEPKDLKIDTYRSSGPGGQHMQKTDSAVRITHIPSGVVVTCQDERSQGKNKAKAMRILRARLLDLKEQAEARKIARERKSQVGTGERSEKIRTYNFPDRRVTDHRINFSPHQLEAVLEGDLDEISDALIKASEEKKNERN
ncbi:MAG: peptide chain release factor 1 [Candidatus Omnitrophota bacterium]|nr:peptide chain release factor 1 [Candidatus Omnitrophota bacterium]